MNFLQQALERVWQTSLSATVLIALGWLVIVCFGKRMPAWGRYGIWLLVFLKLILPIAPPASFSVWNLRKAGRAADFQSPVSQAYSLQAFGQPPAHQKHLPLLPLIWIIGTAGWLAFSIVQHRRLARWVRRQTKCTDTRVLSLVNRAKKAFGVRKQIAVSINERFEAPAIFGWRRPCLLLPAAWLKDASEDELYGVLLHEMAHVKCRDALLNWFCIFVRSAHWFNPFVWYAFRRLRAERELFCDALVLARIQPSERTVYGSMLIKLAAQLSGATAPPTLVPVLQSKPEIHRRINMIAKYKSVPWLLSAAFALLLIALAGITFTRAAEKRTAPPAATPQDKTKPLDALEKQIAVHQDLVRTLQQRADVLHEKLSGQAMDPVVSSGPSEAIQKMQAQQIEAKAEFDRLATLYDHLSKLSRADLKSSISTASPDAQLTELMKQRDMAEQKLADLIEDHAPEHPDVKRITRVLAQINKQIDDRMEGIMRGLEARRDAERARLEAMEKSLAQARQHHFENVLQSRPYQEIVQELRAQEEILQRLRMRMIDERINRALEQPKGK